MTVQSSIRVQSVSSQPERFAAELDECPAVADAVADGVAVEVDFDGEGNLVVRPGTYAEFADVEFDGEACPVRGDDHIQAGLFRLPAGRPGPRRGVVSSSACAAAGGGGGGGAGCGFSGAVRTVISASSSPIGRDWQLEQISRVRERLFTVRFARIQSGGSQPYVGIAPDVWRAEAETLASGGPVICESHRSHIRMRTWRLVIL